MLTPMTWRINIENIIMRSPAIADDTISFPSVSRSGLPALVRILKPPRRMRINAITPAIPVPVVKSFVNKPSPVVVIQPRAVYALLLSTQDTHTPCSGLDEGIDMHTLVPWFDANTKYGCMHPANIEIRSARTI